jgi:hypothetical protein
MHGTRRDKWNIKKIFSNFTRQFSQQPTRMRTATRDSQRYLTGHLMFDISTGLAVIRRRLCLIESHTSSFMQSIASGPTSIAATESTRPAEQIRTKSSKDASTESAYWYETAMTLSDGNTELTEKLTACEARCEVFKDTVCRLTQQRKQLEEDLTSAQGEIIRLSSSAGAIAALAPITMQRQSIPVNTQGKDALYWYQTCRTMEAQYIEKIAGLETTIKHLIDENKRGAITSDQAKRRKRAHLPAQNPS